MEKDAYAAKMKAARKHGRTGERKAIAWLKAQAPNIQIAVINDLLDILAAATWIEIKTCAASILSADTRVYRAGRFTIEKAQHAALCEKDGYFLFVVLNDKRPPFIFLVLARDLPYHRQISWREAMKHEKSLNDCGIVAPNDA